MAMSILDVTDPTKPELVYQAEVPHNDVRGNSLAIRGDTLLLASQCKQFGQQPAGFTVFDMSDPIQPREVAFFDTSGPHSQGVHYVSLIDGRYAHITTGAADFEPNHPKDHQFYMIVDLEDRSNPNEVGRWWLPGQRKGDPEGPLKRHEPRYDFGYRPHNILCFPERPDRAYIGYIDGGIIILDIADKATRSWSAGWTTIRRSRASPTPSCRCSIAACWWSPTRRPATRARTGRSCVWMVDVREETNPIIISTLPFPSDFDELHRVGGRIGAHNIHENDPEPGSAILQNTVVAAWFSAGLRVYDIRNPFRPEEIAAFLPETPDGQRGCRISDCSWTPAATSTPPTARAAASTCWSTPATCRWTDGGPHPSPHHSDHGAPRSPRPRGSREQVGEGMLPSPRGEGAGGEVMDLQLKDKVVMVVGATGGIGAAVAEAFAAEGAQPGAGRARPGEARGAGRRSSAGATLSHATFTCDLLDAAQPAAVVREVEAQFGRLDVIVNCAGNAQARRPRRGHGRRLREHLASQAARAGPAGAGGAAGHARAQASAGS